MENSLHDCEWTTQDTEICVKAEASGLPLNLETNQLLSIAEMIKIGEEFEKVRNSISVDEFLNSRVKSVSFDYRSASA